MRQIFVPSPVTRRLLTAAALLTMSAGLAEAGPFDRFAGNWSGSGTILVGESGKERIRCRATYRIDNQGTTLNQDLRCASDSYRFDLSSNVVNSGGNLSGSWGETTRGVSGFLEGNMTRSGDVQAQVTAVGFNANLRLRTRGGRQTISIRSDNTDLRGVDISLAKR